MGSIKDFQIVATPTNTKVSGKVTPAPKERELPIVTQVKVEKEVTTNQGWSKKYTGVVGIGYARYRGRVYEVLNPQTGGNVDTYPARLNLADPKDPGNIHKRRDVSRWDCEAFKYLTDEESEKKAQAKKDKEAIAAKQRAVNSVIPEEQSPWKDKFHGTYKLTSVYTGGYLYDIIDVVIDPDKETFPEELVVKPCAINNRTLTIKVSECKSFYYPHRNFNQENQNNVS